MQKIREVPVNLIKVGAHEQRIESNDPDVAELARSIERLGVLVPIILIGDGDNFLIVAGHRRFAAAKQAGLTEIPAIIRDEEKAVASEITFAENFFRKNLTPIELACALKDCLDRETMKVEELAAGFHKSVHWVESMVGIANWPGDVQEALHMELLSVAAASNIALVTDDVYRDFLLRNAAESGATARTTAAWLQAWRAMAPQEEAITAEPVPGHHGQVPLTPQAPCFCCSQLFAMNEMSHVPACGACIKIIRTIGTVG